MGHDYSREIDRDTLSRAFFARLSTAEKSAEEFVREYRHNTAEVLMSIGICLIPSEHLRDDQFVVSQGVYDAAKKIRADHVKEMEKLRDIPKKDPS